MSQPLHRTAHLLDNLLDNLHDSPHGPGFAPGVPGKMPVTARLSGRSQVVLRVESAEAARELAGAFGPRDGNGVAAGSEAAVERASASSGHALPGEVRDRFEASLGADLSAVRIHTGGDSASAAGAVGARAYTTGSDIHFGAGQYDPSSAFGVHLLAHEVAHTVQQQGGPAVRQHKLEVSTPGDAHEREADAAADAMVTGRPTEVGSMHGLARQAAPDAAASGDQGWATETRDKIQAVQGAAQRAADILNADAHVALAGLRGAQQSYLSFEMAYDRAVTRFTGRVKQAMKAAEDLRLLAKTGASVALAGLSGGVSAFVKQAGDVVDKMASAGQIIGALQPPGKLGAEKADVNPGGTTQTDWKALLATTIGSYEKYLLGNEAIAATNRRCLTSVQWLNAVIAGTAASGARSSAEGAAADKLRAGADQAIDIFAAIGPGMVSAGATELRTGVATALDRQTERQIEQDVAIKWISTLTGDQTEAIGDAEGYLRELGVINAKGNRLGCDTGMLTSEWDTKVIQARAQVEMRARAMVGTVRTWGGGKPGYGQLRGTVHGDSTSSDWWPAVGPMSLGEAHGGQARLLSYSTAPVDSDVSSEWQHVNESELAGRMIGKVTFVVEPAG